MPSSEEMKERADIAMKALDHLNLLYKVDRHCTLFAAMLSYLLLMGIIVAVFIRRDTPWETVVIVFGAAGVVTIAIERVRYFFAEGLKLLRDAMLPERDPK